MPPPPTPPGVTAGQHAPFVCVNCKARKKRCTKELPSCSYCAKNSLLCCYTPPSSSAAAAAADPHASAAATGRGGAIARLASQSQLRPADLRKGGGPGMKATVLLMESLLGATMPPNPGDVDAAAAAEAMSIDAAIHQQVGRIIAAYGKYMDEISVSYFQGVHRWLPILSRRRFHDRLMSLQASPVADFSILLMAICLVTHHSARGAPPHDAETLYLATKALFAHVQSVVATSVDLVRAGLLIATYEYAQGLTDAAYVSIGVCARMAHILALPGKMLRSGSGSAHALDPSDREQCHELHNLVWGIVLCDRFIVSETFEAQRPFAIEFPAADVDLPLDLDHVERDGPTPGSVCSFAREAQAAHLYETVLAKTRMHDARARCAALSALDTTIQAFLRQIMDESAPTWGLYCGSITFAIGALFILHEHIIAQGESSSEFAPMLNASRSAVVSTSRIVVDIARCFNKESSHIRIETLPPRYAHLVTTALHVLAHSPDIHGEEEVEPLRVMLRFLEQRWNVAGKQLELLDRHISGLKQNRHSYDASMSPAGENNITSVSKIGIMSPQAAGPTEPRIHV